MCVVGHWPIGRGHKQPPCHAEMHDPLGRWFFRALVQKAAARSAKLANNVFSGAMNSQKYSPLKTFALSRWRCFEGLRLAAEPGMKNAVAAYPLVDATGYGFHFRQFGHASIVEECDLVKRSCTFRLEVPIIWQVLTQMLIQLFVVSPQRPYYAPFCQIDKTKSEP